MIGLVHGYSLQDHLREMSVPLVDRIRPFLGTVPQRPAPVECRHCGSPHITAGEPCRFCQVTTTPKLAPAEDAFTILDLFALLASDKRCHILTESKDFAYSRIGRKAVSKDVMFTVTEADQIAASAEMVKTLAGGRDVASVREALTKLNSLVNDRKKSLKFSLDTVTAVRGYSIEGLVWNSTMPNLSFRVRKFGDIDMEFSGAPNAVKAALPDYVPTFQVRAYTVVKDGLVHIDRLPVDLPAEVVTFLKGVGVIPREAIPYGTFVLDLKAIPVINQKMITDASAKELAEMEWALACAKAACKVYDHFAPEKEQTGIGSLYGALASEWLRENGVTDGGYSPETTDAPSTDVNYVTSLAVKIPGLSSLAKVEDTIARMAEIEFERASGKAPKKPKALTASMKLLAPYCEGVLAMQKAHASDADVVATWLSQKAKDATHTKRTLEREIAKQKFAIVVGGAWFKEFSSMAENKLTVRLDGEDREVTFDLNDRTEINALTSRGEDGRGPPVVGVLPCPFVTGSLTHFRTEGPVQVLTPAAQLSLFETTPPCTTMVPTTTWRGVGDAWSQRCGAADDPRGHMVRSRKTGEGYMRCVLWANANPATYRGGPEGTFDVRVDTLGPVRVAQRLEVVGTMADARAAADALAESLGWPVKPAKGAR